MCKQFLLLILFFGILSCSENKKETSAEVSASPSVNKAFAEWFKLDADKSDWQKSDLVLEECGGVGGGSFNKIDVKGIYLTNDQNYFYLYIETATSLEAKYKERGASISYLTIYVDTDQKSSTGSKGEVGFAYGDLDGYEFKVDLNVWQTAHSDSLVNPKFKHSYKPDVKVIKPSSNGTFAFDDVFTTTQPEKIIADGADGVELAFPIDALKVKKGQTVDILFAESAHIFDKVGYSKIKYTVK